MVGSSEILGAVLAAVLADEDRKKDTVVLLGPDFDPGIVRVARLSETPPFSLEDLIVAERRIEELVLGPPYNPDGFGNRAGDGFPHPPMFPNLNLPAYCREHFEEHVRGRPSLSPRTMLPPPLDSADMARIDAAEKKRERKRKANLK